MSRLQQLERLQNDLDLQIQQHKIIIKTLEQEKMRIRDLKITEMRKIEEQRRRVAMQSRSPQQRELYDSNMAELFKTILNEIGKTQILPVLSDGEEFYVNLNHSYRLSVRKGSSFYNSPTVVTVFYTDYYGNQMIEKVKEVKTRGQLKKCLEEFVRTVS
jgi:hypothetical protein